LRLSFIIALLICLGFGIGVAQAADETFTKPTYKGNRLAWCKDWGSGCGKGAASAYCASLGFGDATDFKIDEDIGRKAPTRMIGNNQTCNKPFCDGFRFINCNRKSSPQKEKQTFGKPKWKGYRLDWCVKPGTGCGKDAADLFCKASGFTKAIDFSPALKIGVQSPTRMIGTNAICNTIICNGFQSITCVEK
jgi:hypothetical protein